MRIVLAVLLSVLAGCASAPEGPARERALMFSRVTVIDVERGTASPESTVVVSGGRIAEVGPAAAVRAPRGAAVVDGRGRYLIPGLWDAHAHLSYAGVCALPLMVTHGVTSVRDLGGRLDHVQAWRTRIQDGSLVGPTIKAAGPNVEAARWLDAVNGLLKSEEDLKHYDPFADSPRLRVEDAASARAVVDQLAGMGVDVVKFRNLSGESFKALAEQARLRGLPLAGHSPSGLTLAEAAEAGQGSIEHGETLSNRLMKTEPTERAAMFARMAAAGTMITPTLVADYVRVATDADQQAALDRPGPDVSPSLLKMWRFGFETRRFNDKRDWAAFYVKSAGDMKAARAAGVRMMVGTDLGVILIRPGVSVHDEMALMAKHLSMTPAEVLAAATVNPARFFGLQAQTGVIRSGAAADLVLLGADPLASVEAVRRIDGVAVGGRWLDRSALDRIAADARADIAANRDCGAG